MAYLYPTSLRLPAFLWTSQAFSWNTPHVPRWMTVTVGSKYPSNQEFGRTLGSVATAPGD